MDWPTNYSDTTFAQVTVTQPTTAGDLGTLGDYTGPDEPYYFQTLDGFSVKLFYNPSCSSGYKDRFIYFLRLAIQVLLEQKCIRPVKLNI